MGRDRPDQGQGCSRTDAYDELIILMYCHTAASVRTVAAHDLEFALSPAVSLAATGRAIKHRRIGLTFCAMFMPTDHPLQLMLVNTLRKEIESDEVPRIVMAMDFITACPSEFLGPAVAPRLEVLLGNKLQNIRRRAIFALRALDLASIGAPNDSPFPADTHLSHHKPTIMRRLTRAARETHVRADEVGAVDALLSAARNLLESGFLESNDLIPVTAALLERTTASFAKSKNKPQQSHGSARLVSSLALTLECAVKVPQQKKVAESVLIDVAKLALKIIRVFSDRPASPQVLQTFRLVGALPVALVHSLLRPQDQVSDASSSNPAATPAKHVARHPVLIIRPLIVSRDPTERWASLACLKALHGSLWAGVPLDGIDETIPPVLDEWEVGAIMNGLGDPDKTIRQLTMRILYGVDTQLVHAYLEQLITPPPSASSTKHQPGEALEVISFLYAKDGAAFANGVGRLLDKESQKKGVDERLVEGVVSMVHESDQGFRSAFADEMLQRIEKSRSMPLFSSPTVGASSNGSHDNTNTSSIDPTTILLFATTASDTSVHAKKSLDTLLGLLDGRGAGMQEVLLLAALRLVPRLEKVEDIHEANTKVEGFSQKSGLGRHIRRRCELFVRYTKDIEQLRRIVDETRSRSLPEFLQALLSNDTQSNTQPTPKQTVSPSQSPKTTTGRSMISPTFSTISLSNSPALRYNAYAPPQPPPPRTRPTVESPFHRESGDSSTSLDSPFVREGEDLAGEMVLQAADERRRAKGKGKATEAGGHLRLDMDGAPKKTTSLDGLPNPNADLITLSAVESPFREETEFGTLNMSSSVIAGAAEPTSDSTAISSPRFHTAVMTSPRIAGSDLAPLDADAIWSSFDAIEGDMVLGKQTLRGWCEKAPENVGVALREMGIGFVTQKVAVEGENAKIGQEIFAYIPTPNESPDSEVARAVVRLRPAEDGSCLWMLRCGEWDLRVKIRKILDGESE
ncbi:adaptin amino-terminal region protein [Ceratobasidium sp. AG-Ba]|nr:adaptin amino-terminal region protein [Ceratobasidium sp. AG-Ba]